MNGIESFYNPIKIVIDRRLRINKDSNIVSKAKERETHILTSVKSAIEKKNKLRSLGINIKEFNYDSDDQFNDQFVSYLSEIGVNNVLVEGGPFLITELLKKDLVDKIYLFKSSLILGDDSKSFVKNLNFNSLSNTIKMKRFKTLNFSDDTLDIYIRK